MLTEHFAPTGLGRYARTMTINIALLTELSCAVVKQVRAKRNGNWAGVRIPRNESSRFELLNRGFQPLVAYATKGCKREVAGSWGASTSNHRTRIATMNLPRRVGRGVLTVPRPSVVVQQVRRRGEDTRPYLPVHGEGEREFLLNTSGSGVPRR